MRPRLLLLDEPCDKARSILEEYFDIENFEGAMKHSGIFYNDFIWTGLTPIETHNGVVCCPCTGIDHVNAPKVIYLDEEWRSGEGRKITSTAEHTWSLILQLAKLKRMQLSGKTLGIIGLGRIGQQISRYADAFEMAIIGYDRFHFIKETNSNDKIYAEISNFIYHQKGFNLVLQNSDIITLHVPLNESTIGMIGKREFDLMKDGALLVNTSREQVVNTQALLGALDSKKLGGYADDFSNSFGGIHPKDNPPIIQTPHIGGNCIEAREATDIYIAKKAVEYWRSKNP